MSFIICVTYIVQVSFFLGYTCIAIDNRKLHQHWKHFKTRIFTIFLPSRFWQQQSGSNLFWKMKSKVKIRRFSLNFSTLIGQSNFVALTLLSRFFIKFNWFYFLWSVEKHNHFPHWFHWGTSWVIGYLLKLEMSPDPTRAYFWPAVNKRATCLWPRYFLIRPKDIFFTLREKLEKLDIFRGNFPNPNHRWLTQPK